MTEQPKQKVLFICNQNSGRSQMAEALLRVLYGDHYEVYSAGVVPSEVNPYAVQTVEELGVDMSAHYAKSINEFKGTDPYTICWTHIS